MKFATTAVLILASASQALGHYRFIKLIANGQTHGEFQYIRKWTPIYSNSPVENVSSLDMRCNVAAAAAPETLTVNAGSSVGFVSDLAVFHPGPFTAYLSRAPGDVKSYDGSGRWFKIWHKGATSITSSAINWDTTSTQWTFTIPRSTPSGQYLLRIEHTGLHSASGTPGAQFYMSCAQINIANGGSGNPGPLVSFPGAYNANDPSIKINIYWPIPTSYTPPGPPVWTG